MPIKAEGWFIRAAAPGELGPARLERQSFELTDLEEEEVLAEPLLGGWEANMHHALQRQPIDVCRHRGEQRMLLGNSGVVRVLEVGRQVTTPQPGQLAIIWPASSLDRYGYPRLMWAYDAPGTMGCLSTKIKCSAQVLWPLPARTAHPLERWAAFSVKYGAAWSNWKVAFAALRAQLNDQDLRRPRVWGWGGGTTLAQLDLAQRCGCRATMISASPLRRRIIEQTGVTALDRGAYGELSFEEERFATDGQYRQAYLQAERAFLDEVVAFTEGEGVDIFVDYIGSPTFRASQLALGRQGVLTTAGWREGRMITYPRTTLCINRQQLIHTHGARSSEARETVEYAEAQGWLPMVDERIFSFDEIPELAARYAASELGLFTVYRVAS